ncbi:hypothetical protein Acsp03_50720 [Actinomadura sp. NBRC 104412]|nr:hypothetical protein Acsp03_50720 [Actinomadura sp. NBRC 104412]
MSRGVAAGTARQPTAPRDTFAGTPNPPAGPHSRPAEPGSRPEMSCPCARAAPAHLVPSRPLPIQAEARRAAGGRLLGVRDTGRPSRLTYARDVPHGHKESPRARPGDASSAGSAAPHTLR